MRRGGEKSRPGLWTGEARGGRLHKRRAKKEREPQVVSPFKVRPTTRLDWSDEAVPFRLQVVQVFGARGGWRSRALRWVTGARRGVTQGGNVTTDETEMVL